MLFIRMDMKGHWRGTEHRSCFAGSVLSTEETIWEDGISCYRLDNKVEAIESLYKYWTEIASATMDDFEKMQVTVFEGYKLDKWGSDGEDLAICTKTIKEIEAAEFIARLEKAKDDLEYEETITEEEYRAILESLV